MGRGIPVRRKYRRGSCSWTGSGCRGWSLAGRSQCSDCWVRPSARTHCRLQTHTPGICNTAIYLTVQESSYTAPYSLHRPAQTQSTLRSLAVFNQAWPWLTWEVFGIAVSTVMFLYVIIPHCLWQGTHSYSWVNHNMGWMN